MQIKNLTPHPLVIYRMDGNDVLVKIQPDPAGPFRLKEQDAAVSKDWISNTPRNDKLLEVVNWEPEENYQFSVPIVVRTLEATDLPPEEDGVAYVVSLPALMGLRAAGVERRDLFAPDTGTGPYGGVRDDNGQILGVRRLISLGALHEGDVYGGPGWSVEEWEEANPVVWETS